MKIKHLLIVSLAFLIISKVTAQTILGIDVSKWQGTIDWQQVANDGKAFAYVKATEGQTYTDPKFATNAANGNSAGVVMGVYHFARPDNNTGTQDATNFVNVAGNYMGTGFLPPVLDFEDINRNGMTVHLSDIMTSSQLTAWIQEFLTTVQNLTGVTPIVYTSTYYAGYVNSSLSTYGLWIAKPNTSPSDPPTSLGNWNDWMFKQYSWVGSVSGISGNVDLNVFNGSIDDFNELIGNGPLANDECNNPILLTSNTSCMPISGTVNDATNSNWPQASCDFYQGNAHLQDVFYQFVAVNTEQIITVNPVDNLDAVITLYQGTDCNNMTEIGCSDNGGGFGQPEILTATNLTVGQTYWVRVYDYGSQPPSNGDFEICVTHTGAASEDIFLTNAQVTPTTIMAGQNTTAEVNQNYTGNASNVPDVYLSYYLSTDCNLDSSDILLDDQDFSTINTNDPSDEENQILSIPTGTNSGVYYILMVGDATDVISENDENNNTACAQITIIDGSGEDISLTAPTITSTSTVNPGDDIMVEVTQNYTGNMASLPDVYLHTYLSTDCLLDNNDILLNDQDFSTLNTTNTSEVENQTLTIPMSTNAGTYYILFVADATNVITENNENNNTACAQMTITSSTPEDIFLTDVNTSTNAAKPGDTVTIEAIQNYTGNSINIPDIHLYFYLSTNCKLNSSDILLSNQEYSTINANDPSDEESHDLIIPSNINLGKYYILAVADATNVVNEGNEDNNIACIQLIIADLVDNHEVSLKNKVKIFPNPVQSILHFEIAPNININNVEILNNLGQTLQSESLTKNEIDVSNLPSGIYFVKFITDKQEATMFRMVKIE